MEKINVDTVFVYLLFLGTYSFQSTYLLSFISIGNRMNATLSN